LSTLLPTLAVLAGCAAASQEPPPQSPAQDTPVDFIAQAEDRAAEDAVLLLLSQATGAFVGTLVAVGEPPDSWSGYEIASQALTFDVGRVLSGGLQPGRHTVHQWVVAGSKTARADRPGLRDAYTRQGQSYLVLLGPIKQGRQMTLGEGVGPVPASVDLVARAVAALAE